MSVGQSADRKQYNEVIFPYIWKNGLKEFATCMGMFEMEKCEISPRWNIEGHDTMNRTTIFKTDEDLFDYVRNSKPHSLQLGGIMPCLPASPYFNPLEVDREVRSRDKEACNDGSIVVF